MSVLTRRESYGCRYMYIHGTLAIVRSTCNRKEPRNLTPTSKTYMYNTHSMYMSMHRLYCYLINVNIFMRDAVTGSACFMISLQFLSTWLNLRPSSGIWAMMSGEEKMGSKYSQVACTFSHSSRISCTSSSFPSHSLRSVCT